MYETVGWTSLYSDISPISLRSSSAEPYSIEGMQCDFSSREGHGKKDSDGHLLTMSIGVQLIRQILSFPLHNEP